jgi:hypothetical protein
MQRQLVPLVATHSCVERRWIPGDDPAYFVLETHRDRRVDVVFGAATHEKVRDGPMRVVVGFIPAGRPSDHLELVVVAMSDDVTAGVSEETHDVEAAGSRGPVHGIRVVALLFDVRADATLQEKLDGGRFCALRRGMKQGVLVGLVAGVDRLGMLVEQRRQCLDVAFLGGLEQLAFQRQRVNVRLERTPAGESVLFGEVELRVGELGFGIGLPQLSETLFRLFAQPIEAGGVRQGKRRGRRLGSLFGHVSPSFPLKGRALSCRPWSAIRARIRRLFKQPAGVG